MGQAESVEGEGVRARGGKGGSKWDTPEEGQVRRQDSH